MSSTGVEPSQAAAEYCDRPAGARRFHLSAHPPMTAHAHVVPPTPTERSGRACRLVVVVGSAGGIEALLAVLGALPANFPAPIVVVQHRTAVAQGVLPRILARRSALRVTLAADGATLVPGTVYVAPADHHVLVGPGGTLQLVDGRRIKHVLSSANPLFESAARVVGPRVIAVVLSGSGSDGTDGVQAVKASGGIVVAQDQATSGHFSMPRAAIQSGSVDYVLPIEAIGPALVSLAVGDSEAQKAKG